MAFLLVHESDFDRALACVANPESEHYLCGVEVDRFGVCNPGNAFKVSEKDPFADPIPVSHFRYLPMAMPAFPRWY